MLSRGGVLIVLVLTFWSFLTLAYCIPEQALREHGEESAQIVIDEGNYPDSPIEGDLGIDNFTVAWMLNIAVHGGGNPFVASLENHFTSSSEGDLQEWLDDPGVSAQGSYPRYWHGYLVYLKPLLVFFDIRQIRFLFQVIFILLMFATAISFVRCLGNRGAFVAMAFAFSYAIMHGFDAVAVLPMFPSFAISVIGALWALHVKEDRWCICRGFVVIGAFTVFFDLLDNPILTLGMPLSVIVLRLLGEKSSKWILSTVVLAAVSWACAYCFVWSMKWVLCTIVTGRDVIDQALVQANYRMGGGDQGEYNHFTIILKGYAKNLVIQDIIIPVIGALLLLFFVLLVACVALRRKGRLEGGDLWASVGLYVLVGALPYLWILIFGNHSAEHSFFTYRNQIITVFALLLCIQSLMNRISFDTLLSARRT